MMDATAKMSFQNQPFFFTGIFGVSEAVFRFREGFFSVGRGARNHTHVVNPNAWVGFWMKMMMI